MSDAMVSIRALKAAAKVIKTRFPNLTVEETLDIASLVLLEAELGKSNQD